MDWHKPQNTVVSFWSNPNRHVYNFTMVSHNTNNYGTCVDSSCSPPANLSFSACICWSFFISLFNFFSVGLPPDTELCTYIHKNIIIIKTLASSIITSWHPFTENKVSIFSILYTGDHMYTHHTYGMYQDHAHVHVHVFYLWSSIDRRCWWRENRWNICMWGTWPENTADNNNNNLCKYQFIKDVPTH